MLAMLHNLPAVLGNQAVIESNPVIDRAFDCIFNLYGYMGVYACHFKPGNQSLLCTVAVDVYKRQSSYFLAISGFASSSTFMFSVTPNNFTFICLSYSFALALTAALALSGVYVYSVGKEPDFFSSISTAEDSPALPEPSLFTICLLYTSIRYTGVLQSGY